MRRDPASAGILGWPVAHAKSPIIHRFWLDRLGMDGDYGRFPVHPDDLGAAVRALPALGLRGVNVTVPHKIAIINHLDTISAAARAIGAVNTVTVGAENRLHGENTDVDGILEPLRHFDLARRRIVIAGAGGAARAALAAAIAAGAGAVTVLARDAAKAAALLDGTHIAGSVMGFADNWQSDDVALFFNATTLGMTGQPAVPVDLAALAADAIVFDAVYVPLETPLLAVARARGLRVIDGLQMLIGQAAAAFEAFYGVAAPRRFDADLRALLTA